LSSNKVRSVISIFFAISLLTNLEVKHQLKPIHPLQILQNTKNIMKKINHQVLDSALGNGSGMRTIGKYDVRVS
jgi:hypothetical protein